MRNPTSSSTALPVAHVALRILIVVNWLLGVGIAVLLLALPTRQWIMSSLGLSPSAEADRIIFGLRSIAVIGLVSIPVNYVVLKRLLLIVQTVRSREPFAADNASRLQAIAWALLTLQLLSVVVALIARSISTPAHPIEMNAGFSITGWLTVILTFVLARVFAEGAAMREDLEGTV